MLDDSQARIHNLTRSTLGDLDDCHISQVIEGPIPF